MFDGINLCRQTLCQIRYRLSVLFHAVSWIVCIPTAGIKLAQKLRARIKSYSLVWLRLQPHAHFTISIGITAENAMVQQIILGETFIFFSLIRLVFFQITSSVWFSMWLCYCLCQSNGGGSMGVNRQGQEGGYDCLFWQQYHVICLIC